MAITKKTRKARTALPRSLAQTISLSVWKLRLEGPATLTEQLGAPCDREPARLFVGSISQDDFAAIASFGGIERFLELHVKPGDYLVEWVSPKLTVLREARFDFKSRR